MSFKLGAELLDEARDRARGGIAEGTKSLSVDVVGDVQEQPQVLGIAVAVLDARGFVGDLGAATVAWPIAFDWTAVSWPFPRPWVAMGWILLGLLGLAVLQRLVLRWHVSQRPQRR